MAKAKRKNHTYKTKKPALVKRTPKTRTLPAKAATAKALDLTVKLNSTAKEINVRLEKAKTANQKAQDHRLAAALLLAEARTKCNEGGVKFKSWVADNIMQSYDTVRKLASVGASENPTEALENIRLANKEHSVTKRKKLTKAKELEQKVTPYQRATKAVEVLEDQVQLNLATSIVGKADLVVISKTELKEIKKLATSKDSGTALETVIIAFDTLSLSDRMRLVEYGAKRVGVTITVPTFDDPMALPESLKRSKKKSRKS
ncbi:MAG: hypothetical protein V3V96_15510 [Acidiferrobacterales bacterium]